MKDKLKLSQSYEANTITAECSFGNKRIVATELPLALSYNGVAHVVMMVTPSDIEDFILGFSISEGIITLPADIEEMIIKHDEKGILANVWVKPELHKKLLGKNRNLVGQSGCGLCGIEALENAIRDYEVVGKPPSYSYSVIHKALKGMDQCQPLHKLTGAVHGAAFLSENGKVLLSAEDIGRHNAFDKLIGKIYSAGHCPEKGAVILTSRCSFELVQKALSIRLPLLVTISAPTSLACNLAKNYGLTLITLARQDSFLVMNDPHKMLVDAED